MKNLYLRGKQSKNGKYHSYKEEIGKVADNLLHRDFYADKPFEKLTTDVTMENFFGRLKVEMYYSEKFESPRGFIEKMEEYIYHYNHERISLRLKGMNPVQYRAHSQTN